MTQHRFQPLWRDSKTSISVYEDRTLQSYCAMRIEIVRFCVSATGRLVSGDAMSVLHPDILQVALRLGDDDILVAGVAVRREEVWHVWLQAIAARKPLELLPRLLTWLDFTRGAQFVFEDGWNPDF